MIFASVAALRSASFKPQVCIVGSGPAGISLALRLEQKRVPCIIVEAGGAAYDAAAQNAYHGNVVGDRYFDLAIARVRQFGGSSNHWGGWCRALETYDFEVRPWIDHSGWPIGKSDLLPYAQETESILEIDIAADKPLTDSLKQIRIGFSPPVRFADKYGKKIESSKTIGLLLNTPLVDILPANGRIDSIAVRSKDGRRETLVAPFFVLCGGGIENSRLLLAANALHRDGVVPDPRTLGRFWMEHPHSKIGEAVIFDFTGQRTDRGISFLAPTQRFMKEQRIGNFQSRMLIGEKLSKALLRDVMCHAPQLLQKLADRYVEGSLCSAELHLEWEQVPQRDNRIELDKTRTDGNGVPRTTLHWRQGDMERRTAQSAVAEIGAYFAQEDIGRVKIAPWLQAAAGFSNDEQMAGFHHMGGTRMASSPENGVVDADCRVFGVDNLFVGGSSVFATSGHANPTYTIVQLALRLGDHLAGRVGSG